MVQLCFEKMHIDYCNKMSFF